MVGAETKMDILIQALHFVCVVAPVIASRRRNFDAHLSQDGERVQSSVLADGRCVLSICEVIKRRDSVPIEWILLRHQKPPALLSADSASSQTLGLKSHLLNVQSMIYRRGTSTPSVG